MPRLTCPWCGVRDEDEYRCGGEDPLPRPELRASDEIWGDYLFSRHNFRGVQAERWLHVFGCGRWFNVLRNTVTHEVVAVYRLGELSPRMGEQA